MKTTILTLLLALLISGTNLSAQQAKSSEDHGSSLNLGLGIGGYYGYYHYVNQTLPVFNINYELGVTSNFTLAPFVTFYSYRNDHDHYRETIMPLGVKGSVYLDQLLGLNSHWDIYVAGSLGFAVVKSTWDVGYSGNTYYQNVSPLFLDFHIGTEYHLNNRVGLFVDFSTGVSTVGLAIH
ncbi:MAG: hypothetical protein AUJ98_03800 [Bacteroidetes bacterium CG2_30_33_31]|nr:MAG: hypothetical protein AUJ98_03800 [Bacteroidetes bacterium CG2_30_33_31]